MLLVSHRYTQSEGMGWGNFIEVEKLILDGLVVDDVLRARVDLTIYDRPKSSITSAFTLPATTVLKPAMSLTTFNGISFNCNENHTCK